MILWSWCSWHRCDSCGSSNHTDLAICQEHTHLHLKCKKKSTIRLHSKKNISEAGRLTAFFSELESGEITSAISTITWLQFPVFLKNLTWTRSLATGFCLCNCIRYSYKSENYLNRRFHLQRIPNDKCSRRSLRCWYSWHQHGNCRSSFCDEMLVDSCHHIQLYLDNKREKLLQLGKKHSAPSFCYVVIKQPLQAINKGYPGHFCVWNRLQFDKFKCWYFSHQRNDHEGTQIVCTVIGNIINKQTHGRINIIE